ncbi:MAG: TetR/AcrR family transcriptional regulator [Coriobacteriaceae bacterium]|nr:TetR/AcrR family transcriptional regulator [Coriobacteriaceae bacterium]
MSPRGRRSRSQAAPGDLPRWGTPFSGNCRQVPDKQAALNVALDDLVNDIVDRLRAWNASRVPGDIEGSLVSGAAVMKELVLGRNDLPLSLASSGGASLYTRLVDRIADRTARYMMDSTVQDYARLHSVKIEHVHETFYVLITGLIMFIKANPEVPDRVLIDVIVSSLHVTREAGPQGSE